MITSNPFGDGEDGESKKTPLPLPSIASLCVWEAAVRPAGGRTHTLNIYVAFAGAVLLRFLRNSRLHAYNATVMPTVQQDVGTRTVRREPPRAPKGRSRDRRRAVHVSKDSISLSASLSLVASRYVLCVV
jgi:hypothetical protein